MEENRAKLIKKLARNNATYFLERHHVNKFPVDIFKLCKNDGITLIPYSAPEARRMAGLVGVEDWVDQQNSFIVRAEEKLAIFWNDTLPIDHQRFVIAKVLGLVQTLNEKDDEIKELKERIKEFQRE